MSRISNCPVGLLVSWNLPETRRRRNPCEQVCICMRYVDDTELSVREDFVGFHDIIGTTAVELYDLLIKSINNLGLKMQAYDGASMFLVTNLDCRHYFGDTIQKLCIPTALVIILI